MSLIEEMMTECCYMNKSKVDDGEGGSVTEWSEGAHFNAAVVLQNSSIATIAEAIKQQKTYTVTINRATNLEFNDVFKRLSDGLTFKVTTDAEDNKTPTSSGLMIAQVSAERWDLA